MRKRKQFCTFGLSKHVVIIKSLFTSELANLIYFRKKSDSVFFYDDFLDVRTITQAENGWV